MRPKTIRQGYSNPEAASIQRSLDARHAELIRGLDRNKKASAADKKLSARRIWEAVKRNYEDDISFV